MGSKELFKRFENNPIITANDFPDDWPEKHGWSPHAVFNPGVGDLDGKTLLLVRVADRRKKSRLVCFISKDGKTNWEINENTIFTGEKEEGKEENYGVEDSRLTWMTTLNQWAIVYTHYSKDGPLVSIAMTKNFKEYSYLGNILPPENKDAALFPEPINGYWWLIHRPVVGDNKQIWIAKSKCTNSGHIENLCRWGGHQILLPAYGTPWWDGTHIGLSAPPLKTNHGWLILYHGVEGGLYRLGLAMLSLDDPTKVTHRTREFIMSPQESCERIGDVDGALFPCGWRVHDDGKVRLYYGIADLKIGYAEAPLDQVIERVLKDPV